jgi:hypothetical protein
MVSGSETELSSLADPANMSEPPGSVHSTEPHSPDSESGGGGSKFDLGRKRNMLTKRAERYRRITPRKVTHRKGENGSTPLADADDGEHSLMHSVAAAWRAAMREPSGGDTDDSSDAYGEKVETELRVEPMLEAFACTLNVAEQFGPLLGLAVKNDQANFDKVRTAWTALSESGDASRCASLRGLLEAERASGIHMAGGVLADPSAAIALVWMRRSLDFQNAVLDGMHTDRAAPLSNIARDAYRTHLESFHNFWLKSTFRAGLSAMPSRSDFIDRLTPGLDETMEAPERELLCYTELAELTQVQQKAIAAVGSLLVELDMEDRRKV